LQIAQVSFLLKIIVILTGDFTERIRHTLWYVLAVQVKVNLRWRLNLIVVISLNVHINQVLSHFIFCINFSVCYSPFAWCWFYIFDV